MTGRKFFIFLFIILCVFTRAYSAEITTHLQSDEVYQGEAVLLEIAAEDANSVEPVELPQVAGLDVSYSGVMRSYQNINGVRSNQLILRFVLKSDQPGTYSVPSFRVLVNREEVMTDPVTLTVREGTPTPRNNDPFGAFGSLIEPDRRQQRTVDFEGVRILSRDVCYAGETVVVRYYVKGDADINFVPRRLWNTGIESMVLKQIDEHLPDVYVEENGRKKRKVHLRTFAITPAISGNYIAENEIASIVYEISNGIFSHGVEKNVRFSPATIDVLPLPEEGKPDNFSGNIGFYSLSMHRPDKTEIEQHEEYTFSLMVRGLGSFPGLKSPENTSPDKNLVLIENGSENDYTLVNSTYQGSVSYNYSLVAEEAGSYTVGPFELNYFDPSSGTYKTARTESFQITVHEANLPDFDETVLDKKTLPRELIYISSAFLFFMILGGIFVFQLRNEAKKRREFHENRKKVGRNSKAKVFEDENKVDAEAINLLYRNALKKALESEKHELLFKEIKRSIEYMLKHKKFRNDGEQKLKNLRNYLVQTAYGGGSPDLRILKDIAGKILEFL